MAIGNVIEKNGIVYTFKPDGSHGVEIKVSSLPGSGLKGYTSDTFNIQQGGSIYTYNETGQVIGSLYVGSAFPTVKQSEHKNAGGWVSFIFQAIIFCLLAYYLIFHVYN